MAKYTFYRPHDRSATWETGEVLDTKTGEITTLPSMTKQSFVEQCDINNVLKQYKRTGMINHVSAHAGQGQYLDLPDDLDFQTALETVMRGEDAFATLPSKLRLRFGNDPQEFLEFMSDPANADEIVELGLATARPTVQEPLVSEANGPQPSPQDGK